MNIFLNAFRKVNFFLQHSFPNAIKSRPYSNILECSIAYKIFLNCYHYNKLKVIWYILEHTKLCFQTEWLLEKRKNNFIPSLKEKFWWTTFFSKNTLRGISREICVFNKLLHELKYIFLKFNLEFFFEFSIQSIAYFFRHTKYYKRFLINKMIGNRSGS